MMMKTKHTKHMDLIQQQTNTRSRETNAYAKIQSDDVCWQTDGSTLLTKKKIVASLKQS